MKTLLLLLVLLCNVSYVFSQSHEIDSLISILNTERRSQNETAFIKIKLGWLYNSIRQYDSSLFFYKQALSLQHLITPYNIGAIHLGMGSCYIQLDQPDSSFYHSKAALNIFEAGSDTSNMVIAYANLAVVCKEMDLYDEALEYGLRVATILEESEPSFSLASAYSTVALILTKARSYPEAIIYHRRALVIFKILDASSAQAKTYNNLGELFILTKQYDSARRNLSLAARMKRDLNDKQGLARTLTRLGKVFMLTGDLPGAKRQFQESLATQREINDSVGIMETLNSLGELYLNTHSFMLAGESLNEASKLIRQSRTPEHLRQNLELRIRLAREQKDFANGMMLLEELLIIRDSLLNEEKSKSLQAMQIRYETQKKEQEIALLEQREEINQARIQSDRILIGALIAGLLLFAAIGALIYLNLRNARAAKERIELLLAETRHRFKNNLQTLASIFHLQTRHYTDQEMVLEARSSESRIHTMSLLNEKFYSTDTNHIVGTRDFITDIVHKLVDIYGAQTHNLKLSLDIDDIKLDIDKALALSLIIQELTCNAFKYAFDHEANPKLLVQLLVQEDMITTSVHDNGVGFIRTTTGTSQGLNLVDALVAQLDGEIQIDNHNGTTFTIRFPVTSPWKKHEFSL